MFSLFQAFIQLGCSARNSSLGEVCREKGKEHLWANLTKRPDIPSNWSILTVFINTQVLLTQIRNMIRWRSETLSVTLFKSEEVVIKGP